MCIANAIVFNETSKRIVRKTLGIPIRKEEEVAVKLLLQLILLENPPVITTVGDVVTINLIRNGYTPDLAIVDFYSKRKPLDPSSVNFLKQSFSEIMIINNPRSTISNDALRKLRMIYSWLVGKRKRKILVKVEGEEDLLTLVAILYSPEKAFVIYGQPNEALVVVMINKYVKDSIREFLKSLTSSRS